MATRHDPSFGAGLSFRIRVVHYRRELRRRSAIEPLIGHMKSDGRLDRHFLAGVRGDAINALLCGAGYNLRLILERILCQHLLHQHRKTLPRKAYSAPL